MRLEGGGIQKATPLQLGSIAQAKHNSAMEHKSNRSATRQLAAKSAKENNDPLQGRHCQCHPTLPPDTW